MPELFKKRHCIIGGNNVKYSPEQKSDIICKYYSGSKPSKLAEEYGISPNTVHIWKKQLLCQETNRTMPKIKRENHDQFKDKATEELLKDKTRLECELHKLQEGVYRLQMQKDILEKAGEIIKKDQGISPDELSNREKALLIDALRDRYRLKDLLYEIHMPKSSYCYQRSALKKPDKYATLRDTIKACFEANYCAYGYRRVYRTLKNDGIRVSEKVIRRLMSEEGLAVCITVHKKYNSYKGEISPEVPNILERNFHANEPNRKWLTDITEFRIPAGKVYLSPIIDCFDGFAVTWSIDTTPDAEFVNSMLDNGISVLKDGEKPIIHSDRGCHYRWPGWINRMDTAGLTRSMSKKACSPDNAACEGFFGRLKNEMFYGRSWMGVSVEAFAEELDRYIRWYNEKRIKESLGWMSPLEYRQQLGFAK